MAEVKSIKIKSGDTLSGLAKQYNTTVGEIMKINTNIKDPNKIIAGQEINISFDMDSDVSSENIQSVDINSAEDFLSHFNLEQPVEQSSNVENIEASQEESVETPQMEVADAAPVEDIDSTDVTFDFSSYVIDNGLDAALNGTPEAIATESKEDTFGNMKDLYNDATGNGSWDTEHHCAAFVRRQLNSLGVANDSGHDIPGKDYAEFIHNGTYIQDGYKAIGTEVNSSNQQQAFENIIAANGGSASNVIISFDGKSGSSFTDSAGHAVLIYKVQDNNVYFMDNFGVDGWGTKANKPNSLSIQQFENTYLQSRNSANYITQVVPSDSHLSDSSFI